MFRDLRFAVRNLNKHLWLSLAVVVTLMLGMGISAGVFGFIDAQILRPQLDRDFDSFAQVYSAYTRDPLRPATLGNPTLKDFLAIRERAHSALSEPARDHRFVSGSDFVGGDVVGPWLAEPAGSFVYLLVFGFVAAAMAYALWWPARRAAMVDPLVALRYE